MAQVYKMMLGTSGRQWEQLTVKDDGTMMLYFHGTDRSVTQEVTVVTEGEWKGWLRSEKGSMFPGLESGRWQLMDDGRGLTADVVETTDNTDCTDNHAEPEVIEENTNCTNYTNNEPLIVNRPVRPKRQRKARAYRGQTPCNPSSTSHTGDSPRESGNEWLLSAGYLAAATVALLVIYETGLLIPLGLIGLATSGLLK